MFGLGSKTEESKSGFAASSPAEMAEMRDKAAAARARIAGMRKTGELFSLKQENGEDCKTKFLEGGRNNRNQIVEFHWTTRRNVHGFFVTFRVIKRADGVELRRDDFTARKSKVKAMSIARGRALKFEEKYGEPVRAAA